VQLEALVALLTDALQASSGRGDGRSLNSDARASYFDLKKSAG
jgi:hypothetical protein